MLIYKIKRWVPLFFHNIKENTKVLETTRLYYDEQVISLIKYRVGGDRYIMWMFSVWFIIGREITQPVQIFGWNANPKLPFHKVRNAARESRTGQRTIRRRRNWFGHGGVGLTFGRDVVINLWCLLEFHRPNQVQPLRGPNLISWSWAPSMHDQSWCLDRDPWLWWEAESWEMKNDLR